MTLVVVHGGGKEIDAALAQAAIPKRQVDGLRVTDEATLKVVVAVLAGTINARLVTALNTAGSRAVGLTGADAGVTVARKAKPHRATSGELMDLGLVGEPASSGDAALIDVLCRRALRARRGVHRGHEGRAAAQRERGHAGGQSRGKAAGGAPGHRRQTPVCSTATVSRSFISTDAASRRW